MMKPSKLFCLSSVILGIPFVLFKWFCPMLINILNKITEWLITHGLHIDQIIVERSQYFAFISNRIALQFETALIITIILDLLWITVDLLTGQATRNFKTSAFIRTFLWTGDLSAEEKKSNKIFRRAKIRKQHNKLQISFWGLSNLTVEQKILSRCNDDQFLERYLADKFKDSSWLPLDKRYFGPFVIFETRER